MQRPVKKSDLTKEENRITVRHEGGHAVVIDTLKNEKISFITLDGRGNFLGAVFHNPGDRHSNNFESIIASAATSYAGGLAEPAYATSGHTSGVSGDLENATKIIERAITKWGLGPNTGLIAIDEKSPSYIIDSYKPEIKKDLHLISTTSQKIAKLIVDFHQDFLDKYVKAYEDNAGKGGNNLSGEEFSRLRNEWLKQTGKENELAELQKQIKSLIETAKKGGKELATRLPK